MSEEKNIKEEAVTENESKPVNSVTEEEFLKRVEQAAARGAKRGSGRAGLMSFIRTILPYALIAVLILGVVMPKINSIHDGLNGFTHFEDPAESHDLVAEDNGIFGYTAADFEDAILGDSSKLTKLEVYSQKVSDATTVTSTGLFNWGVFTKMKLITFNGTAVYTVNLAELKKADILFDEEQKIITLRIPHPKQEEINIPEDEIKFGDTTNGLLAFGDIKLTPEQNAAIQSEARKKMQEKLDDPEVMKTAERFAILSVWELYSPIVKGVAKDYSLEVEFR